MFHLLRVHGWCETICPFLFIIHLSYLFNCLCLKFETEEISSQASINYSPPTLSLFFLLPQFDLAELGWRFHYFNSSPAALRLCPDEGISGSMANTITYKYSCNELCWDPGGTNMAHNLVWPVEDPSGCWNASVQSCLLGIIVKGSSDNDVNVVTPQWAAFVFPEFVSVRLDEITEC